MKIASRSVFGALAGVAALLIGGSANASLVFHFGGLLDDGDQFFATLTTEDALTTVSVDAYTSISGQMSPAYTFTGYRIVGISGVWLESGDPAEYEIVELLPIGSSIENAIDTIAHSRTDNLFDPKTLGELAFGKISFGGFAFNVDVAGTLESYQVFTNPVSGEYAGCPGTCVGVKELPAPGTLPLTGFGLGLLAWSRWFRGRAAQY